MKKPIGKMDARITIQRATVTTDDQGSVIETWATLTTAWAATQAVETVGRTDEQTTAGVRHATSETVFSIRFQSILANLNPTDRITWAGGIWGISSAIPLPPSRPSEIVITGVRVADLPVEIPPVVSDFSYLTPDGSNIFQPDGESLYLQPESSTYLTTDGSEIFQPDGVSTYYQP